MKVIKVKDMLSQLDGVDPELKMYIEGVSRCGAYRFELTEERNISDGSAVILIRPGEIDCM